METHISLKGPHDAMRSKLMIWRWLRTQPRIRIAMRTHASASDIPPRRPTHRIRDGGRGVTGEAPPSSEPRLVNGHTPLISSVASPPGSRNHGRTMAPTSQYVVGWGPHCKGIFTPVSGHGPGGTVHVEQEGTGYCWDARAARDGAIRYAGPNDRRVELGTPPLRPAHQLATRAGWVHGNCAPNITGQSSNVQR
jgi:hypothetical protein